MRATRRAATALAMCASLTLGGLVVAPSAHSASYPCSTNQTLRFGNVNKCVRALQTYLNGYQNARLAIDSSFGPATLAAVKKYQRAAGLTADGIVGPKTRDAISARTGTPVKSGATMAQIRAAGNAVMQMCWGWGYSFD